MQHLSRLNARPRIILDTDIGNDIDDALALGLLHALADRDECDIEAVTVCKPNPLAAEFASLINAFYGRADLPIGLAAAGPTPQDGPYLRHICSAYETRASHGNGGRWPSAVEVLRRRLADAADASITIGAIGFANNLAALLNSPADAILPISGRELARRKVRELVWMAGNFTEEAIAGRSDDLREYNVFMDVASADTVVRGWPTPIVFSGWEVGGPIRFPASAIETRFDWTEAHPIADAYRVCKPMPYDRPTWDLTAVMHAVRPNHRYFSLSERGQVQVDSEGFTRLLTDAGGAHRHLQPATDHGRDRILREMVELCSSPPRATPAAPAAFARGIHA